MELESQNVDTCYSSCRNCGLEAPAYIDKHRVLGGRWPVHYNRTSLLQQSNLAAPSMHLIGFCCVALMLESPRHSLTLRRLTGGSCHSAAAVP